MTVRAMWKGVIALGEVRVPFKLYAAITSRAVHFRLLHEEDGVPVEQRLVDPTSGEPVEHGEVRKGFALESGDFVVLTDEDFAAVTPEPSREVEVLRFVPPQALDDRWYQRAYWLGPDGDDEAYAALVEALQAEQRVGIVRWVMRKTPYQGVLRVADGHLMLVTLEHAESVVPMDAIEVPEGRAPDERELSLAEKLIEALQGGFDPAEYADEYADQVRALVEAKARGEAPPAGAPAEPAAAPEGSLTDALEASLAEVGGR